MSFDDKGASKLAALFVGFLMRTPVKAKTSASPTSVAGTELFLSTIELRNDNVGQIVQRADDVVAFVRGTKESSPGMKALIKDFYMAGGDSPAVASKRNSSAVPWSAAIISYLVNPRGLPLSSGGLLKGSLAHTQYLLDAMAYYDEVTDTGSFKSQPKGAVLDAYWRPSLETLTRTGPKLGDILISNREAAQNTYTSITRTTAHGVLVNKVYYSSGRLKVDVVGGNESNTVRNTTIDWLDLLAEIKALKDNPSRGKHAVGKYYAVIRHPQS